VPHPEPWEWWTCAACHGTNGAPTPPGWHNPSDNCQSCHPGGASWNAVTHSSYSSYPGSQCYGCHNP
jgi:hypothetical protein